MMYYLFTLTQNHHNPTLFTLHPKVNSAVDYYSWAHCSAKLQ